MNLEESRKSAEPSKKEEKIKEEALRLLCKVDSPSQSNNKLIIGNFVIEFA